MAIWMDMTNSLHAWKGGVVGIVRAELEIAKNMKRCDPNVRFFKYDGEAFVEVGERELDWLWDCESVGDAYLTAMGRKQTAGLGDQSEEQSIEELRKAYPGLDNAYNFSTSRLHRAVWGLQLYANTLPSGIRGFTKVLIDLIAAPLKKLSLWRAHRKAAKAAQMTGQKQRADSFSHPFRPDDLIFSCGWVNSGKEEGFEKVKKAMPSVFIIYLIYDIILIRNNTKQFYDPMGSADFQRYFHWASMHCDALLYGGKTAMEDSQGYQKEKHLPVPPGYPIYFGSDILRTNETAEENFDEFCKKNGITRDYIMAVGSLDERKNYSTLYRAMTLLARNPEVSFPQLVIVGKGNACQILCDTIERDPLTQENIIFVAPSDEELDQLYKNACFVVLASAWEGWSLTLPEALQYDKFVLASDVAPLKEIGKDFIVYADPYDPLEWANKILYYYQNTDQRRVYEQKVKREYHSILWSDCGTQVYNTLKDLNQSRGKDNSPCIYMDFSLSFGMACINGNISGILRSELMLAKYLYHRWNKIRFFVLREDIGYFEIDHSVIEEILIGIDLDSDFEICKRKIQRKYQEILSGDYNNSKATEYEHNQWKEDAYWFLTSIFPVGWENRLIAYGKKKKKQLLHKAAIPGKPAVNEYKLPFKAGDVVFNASTGFTPRMSEYLLTEKANTNFRYCQLIYDLTPILLPQVHQKATIEHYIPFLAFVSKMSDFILYGGETARKDGIAYQKKMGLPVPPSAAIKFGSDISNDETAEVDEDEVKDVLKRLGIKGPYVLSVGTMEIRKNHETLYRAYLRMLERDEDIPQMVFAGHPGWKTEDFLTTLSRDERVKGKILWLSPTDEELDILYKNCEFTILASLYEGWSLTLPESFWYGKFCLCCDTPALKETAGELSEYVQAWDEKTWSERICYYHSHPQALAEREKAIAEHWHPISWEECAGHVLSKLEELLQNGRA